MTILFIHNYYQERGGEDSVFETESEALEQAGHRVLRYTRHNNELQKYSMLQKLLFLFTAFKNKTTLRDLDRILEANTVDIAHIHNVFPLITPYVYKYLKKKKICIVQTLHNYRFMCPNGNFFRNNDNCMLCKDGSFYHCVIHRCYKKSFIFSLLYAAIIKRNQRNFKKNIDAYIALTDFPRNLLLEQGYARDKIFVKGNAGKNSEIACSGKKMDYFLFLGRLSEEKGIIFLLNTFKKIPDQKLIVAGSADNYDEIIEKYKSLNIDFKGFIRGKDKVKLLSEAIALIVPSLSYDNYPVSIVEAFSCGTPAIGSNIGGIPFIIQDGHDGFLFACNHQQALIEKIRLLGGDERLQARISQNAKNTFLTKMEISTNILKLETIYKTVLSRVLVIKDKMKTPG